MFLQVDGAKLYYQVEGSGPVLLLAQSGEGDADRSVDLVRHLVDEFTVLTYDRRGLSRSAVDDPARPVTVASHAADVAALLAALADEPATMLGCSFGAMIGLRVVVDHPSCLRLLVAHEPSTLGLLPAAERSAVIAELRELQRVHGESGWQAVVPLLQKLLDIDPVRQEREPGLTPQPPLAGHRAANFDWFFTQDCSALVGNDMIAADLAGLTTKVIPAAGRTTKPSMFDHRCAVLLGAALSVPVAEFPGAHNGNLTHPRAFAARFKMLVRNA
jgi:pimeloyl-ACP methyl ester carboxylesterase